MTQDRASSKKIIFWLFLIVFAWLMVTHFTETKKVFDVLRSGRWFWVLMAFVLQIIYYPFYSRFIQCVFKIFRVNQSWREILPISIAAKFTDVALPVATFGTFAVFLRNAKKKNNTTLNTGIAVAFVLIYEILAFTAIALLGFILLYVFDQAPTYLSITFYILLALVAVALYYIIKLSKNETPNRFILWLIRYIARLAGRKNVKIDEIETIFLEIGSDVRKNGDKLASAFYQAVGTHLLNMATLACIFLAFSNQVNVFAVITTYISALLFTIISITPQGVGVVETIMITAMKSCGMDLSVAAVITFAFRSLLYWLPVFPGFYFFSQLELKQEKVE